METMIPMVRPDGPGLAAKRIFTSQRFPDDWDGPWPQQSEPRSKTYKETEMFGKEDGKPCMGLIRETIVQGKRSEVLATIAIGVGLVALVAAMIALSKRG